LLLIFEVDAELVVGATDRTYDTRTLVCRIRRPHYMTKINHV